MKSPPDDGNDSKLKILLFDIETTANIGSFWGGKYEQNIVEILENSHLLCFAYKWLGEDRVHAYGLPDFPGYKRNHFSDKALLKKLWGLIDEADILVAHNGDSFDIKKVNARFVFHGLEPLPPYKTIDTKKWAKRVLNVPSYALNELGHYYGFGGKAETGGYDLWKGCIKGDMKAWRKMVKYNKQDIVLLESLYHLLRPWIKSFPLLRIKPISGGRKCPHCDSPHAQSRGRRISSDGVYNQFQCQECFRWFYVKEEAALL